MLPFKRLEAAATPGSKASRPRRNSFPPASVVLLADPSSGSVAGAGSAGRGREIALMPLPLRVGTGSPEAEETSR